MAEGLAADLTSLLPALRRCEPTGIELPRYEQLVVGLRGQNKVQASYRQTVAGPEKGYVDARGQLEALRLRFIERGRIELKSTSK
jgi:hypothetical protein